ncbi:hypothetical protein GN316_15190 [Xylophilus sp. Kf1]|nr:hypothetical protein [Xylophilus sp. Kf1]
MESEVSRTSATLGLICFLLFSYGCANIELSTKPKNSLEISGVVTERLAVPNYGPTNASSAAIGIGPSLLANSVSMEIEAKLLTVRISRELSFTIPTRQYISTGTCIKLFIDPLYKDIVQKGSGVMSMPINAVFIERADCL